MVFIRKEPENTKKLYSASFIKNPICIKILHVHLLKLKMINTKSEAYVIEYLCT